MMRCCRMSLMCASRMRFAAPRDANRGGRMTPLEAFTQVQLGMLPSISAQRLFLLEYFSPELVERNISEAKLYAMDHRLCAQLLRQVLFHRYLSIPFRIFAFDLEFTGPPTFKADGPTEDITEIGVYSPARDALFSSLVKPTSGRRIQESVVKLTKITPEMLDAAPSFTDVWAEFMEFINTPEPNELPGSEERILLLSHGGKMADVSLLKWTLEQHNMSLPRQFMFGDTIHLIRDAHRRRPVTVDKHPPSWKLADLVQWLKVPPTLPAHRAGNDAKMTWDAVSHTLERYGDETLSPREQLVTRFFDSAAKEEMISAQQHRVAGVGRGGVTDDAWGSDDMGSPASTGNASLPLSDSSLDIDFDNVLGSLGGSKGKREEDVKWSSEQVSSTTDATEHSDADVEKKPVIRKFVL